MGNVEDLIKKRSVDGRLHAPDILQQITNPMETVVADASRISMAVEEISQATKEKQIREENHKQETLRALKSIENNTANLRELVYMIQNNQGEQRTEIIELLKESLGIATAQSIEEADTLYKKVIRKITGATEDVEVMQKAIGWANTIFTLVKTGFEEMAK